MRRTVRANLFANDHIISYKSNFKNFYAKIMIIKKSIVHCQEITQKSKNILTLTHNELRFLTKKILK
jgi:hypothetical protein